MVDQPGERGFDGGKRLTGRKRHLLVDTPGLLLMISVTAESLSDRAGAQQALARAQPRRRRVRRVRIGRALVGESREQGAGDRGRAGLRHRQYPRRYPRYLRPPGDDQCVVFRAGVAGIAGVPPAPPGSRQPTLLPLPGESDGRRPAPPPARPTPRTQRSPWPGPADTADPQWRTPPRGH